MSDPADERAALDPDRSRELEERVRGLLAPLTGVERVLDAGCGGGVLSFALAPYVREVVGVDPDEELLARARAAAPSNCSFVAGDVSALPFRFGEFDVSACVGVLHRVRRPELLVSELSRVTRPGGLVLVVDELGDVDPLVGLEVDRFERERDPEHERFLPDADVRQLLEANNLVVRVAETTTEVRDVERFLDAAGLEGERRERARRLAPGAVYELEVGWYVARAPGV